MRPLTAKQVADILHRNWFFVLRQKGSHRAYKSMKSGAIVFIAFHGNNKNIPPGTLKSIIKQSRLPESEFESDR